MHQHGVVTTTLLLVVAFAPLVQGVEYCRMESYETNDCTGTPVERVASSVSACNYVDNSWFSASSYDDGVLIYFYEGKYSCEDSSSSSSDEIKFDTCYAMGDGTYVVFKSCEQADELPLLTGGLCSATYTGDACNSSAKIHQCIPTTCTKIDDGKYSTVDCDLDGGARQNFYRDSKCSGYPSDYKTLSVGTCGKDDRIRWTSCTPPPPPTPVPPPPPFKFTTGVIAGFAAGGAVFLVLVVAVWIGWRRGAFVSRHDDVGKRELLKATGGKDNTYCTMTDPL